MFKNQEETRDCSRTQYLVKNWSETVCMCGKLVIRSDHFFTEFFSRHLLMRDENNLT